MNGRQVPQFVKVLGRLIKEKEEDYSVEGRQLPLGFTKFNVREAKHVRIPIYKGRV